TLLISGELKFNSGKKLSLACSSVLKVLAGGKLTPGSGGGNSNYITLCGSDVWTAGDGGFTGGSGGFVLSGSCHFNGSGQMTGVGCGVALPVDLVWFSVENDQADVKVSWLVASEINNDHFVVEKSTDHVNYYTIATIAGAGNSTTAKVYEYI